MSLHDTDTVNNDRSNPIPAFSDIDKNRMAHQTVSTAYGAPGTNGNTSRVELKNSRISGYSSTNKPDLLIGRHPVDGHTIIALVKPGLDVIQELSA